MEYYFGQALGIAGTVCSLILPLFKKKWQMLLLTVIVNALFALNLLFIGQVSSAILINTVGVAQAAITLWRTQKGTSTPKAEIVIFFILYVGCGILGFKTPLDTLAIVAAVFNMLATFQRDEQKTRFLILVNVTTFFVYYLSIGSTVMFAELAAAITTVIAIIKYRKKKQETK